MTCSKTSYDIRYRMIDFIAPMGGQEEMLKESHEKIHVGKKIKMLQPSSDGTVGVVEW